MPRFTIGSHDVTVVAAELRKSKSGKRHVRLHFEGAQHARLHRDCWLTEKAIGTTLTILCDGFGLPEPDAPDFPTKLQGLVGRKCRIKVAEELDNLGVPSLVVRWVDVGGDTAEVAAPLSPEEWSKGTQGVMAELRAAMERRAREAQATADDTTEEV